MKIFIECTRHIYTQNQQKVNVWAGILNEAIIGPFFIKGNLNVDNYLTMFQDEIVPAIRNIAHQNFNDICSSKMGHHLNTVYEYTNLNEVFPNRWIGRKGYNEWPA